MISMSKTRKHLCYRCVYFEQEEMESYWYHNRWGRRELVEGVVRYRCNKTDRMIQKIRLRCRWFLDLRTAKLLIGGDGMVKLGLIPTEAERIDLKDLPKEAELMAVSEKMQESAAGRTGGLVITFKLRDGRTFPQKYSPVSGAVLKRAMQKLKLKDTEALQKDWFKYELTTMRIGLPRMIPIKKV